MSLLMTRHDLYELYRPVFDVNFVDELQLHYLNGLGSSKSFVVAPWVARLPVSWAPGSFRVTPVDRSHSRSNRHALSSEVFIFFDELNFLSLSSFMSLPLEPSMTPA